MRFKKKLEKQVVDNPEKKVKQLITRACMIVESRAIESILRDPKTGATYGKHIASAAGEPPASDTGFLARSISFSVEENKGEVIGMVKASAPYAAYLEFGTRNIAPRPYMQPALEQNKPKIRKMFQEGGLIK